MLPIRRPPTEWADVEMNAQTRGLHHLFEVARWAGDRKADGKANRQRHRRREDVCNLTADLVLSVNHHGIGTLYFRAKGPPTWGAEGHVAQGTIRRNWSGLHKGLSLEPLDQIDDIDEATARSVRSYSRNEKCPKSTCSLQSIPQAASSHLRNKPVFEIGFNRLRSPLCPVA